MSPSLYLASQSPRRRELLTRLGVTFEVLALEVDEAPHPGERPEDYVLRLALDKARVGRQGLPPGRPGWVLGADTAVVLDGEILGKAEDEASAHGMLARLGGRVHEVLTAVALVDETQAHHALVRSRVAMRPIAAAERAAYWASGEPLGKAGGYAIQGLGAAFVTHLDGDWTAVMGLPLATTLRLLRRAGIATALDLPQPPAGTLESSP